MRYPNSSRMLTLAAVAATGLISGCSNVPFIGGDDRQANRAANLEAPPEFTRPPSGGTVSLPEIASARAEAMERNESGGVLDAGSDVRVAGEPGSRYLVVESGPDNVWPALTHFLRNEGYTVRRQEPAAGMVETEWTGLASNEGTGFSIMDFLKVATNTLFKPDFIERVRLRIEEGTEAGETLVFVTTQKRELTSDKPLVPGSESDTFKYSTPVDDPSMNAETMARLAAYLSGGSAEEARQMIGAKFSPRSKIVGDEDDERHIVVSQSYPKVWNRVGLALDRLGFDPVSRDRDSGEVEVRHDYPQSLYEGILMRGVSIDRDADMTLHLSIEVEPRRDGGTDVRIDRINVAGGSLPEDRGVVLGRLKTELE